MYDLRREKLAYFIAEAFDILNAVEGVLFSVGQVARSTFKLERAFYDHMPKAEKALYRVLVYRHAVNTRKREKHILAPVLAYLHSVAVFYTVPSNINAFRLGTYYRNHNNNHTYAYDYNIALRRIAEIKYHP